MTQATTAPVPRDAFIAAMRGVAAPVTVVTTDGPFGPAGATVSAFSSVSADPPAVLVCLLAASRIAKAVATNHSFCVNVLPEDAQMIADRFAGRHDGAVGNRFAGIEGGNPTGHGMALAGATVLACDVARIVREGSHLIVVGTVQQITGGVTRPLAWHDGAYQRVVTNPQPRHCC